MKLITRITLPLTITALAITGCSNTTATPELTQETTTQTPTTQTQTPGKYHFTDGNGTVTMEIPASNTPEITALEGLRTAVKAPEVTYIIGDIDNRNGTEKLDPSTTTLHDKNGKEYVFDTASTYVGDNWSPTMREDYSYSYPDGSPMSEAEYDQVNTQSTNIYNSHLNQGDPGERATKVWIFEGEMPEDFTNLTVDVGADSVQPTPVDQEPAMIPADPYSASTTQGGLAVPPDSERAQCESMNPTTATSGAIQYCYMEYGIHPAMPSSVEGDSYTGYSGDTEGAPLREQDPYANLTDEELAELPVTGMP